MFQNANPKPKQETIKPVPTSKPKPKEINQRKPNGAQCAPLLRNMRPLTASLAATE